MNKTILGGLRIAAGTYERQPGATLPAHGDRASEDLTTTLHDYSAVAKTPFSGPCPPTTARLQDRWSYRVTNLLRNRWPHRRRSWERVKEL